jgi:hypothetical protein
MNIPTAHLLPREEGMKRSRQQTTTYQWLTLPPTKTTSCSHPTMYQGPMTTSHQQKKEFLPFFGKTSRQRRNKEATISKAIKKEKVQ